MTCERNTSRTTETLFLNPSTIFPTVNCCAPGAEALNAGPLFVADRRARTPRAGIRYLMSFKQAAEPDALLPERIPHIQACGGVRRTPLAHAVAAPETFGRADLARTDWSRVFDTFSSAAAHPSPRALPVQDPTMNVHGFRSSPNMQEPATFQRFVRGEGLKFFPTFLNLNCKNATEARESPLAFRINLNYKI